MNIKLDIPPQWFLEKLYHKHTKIKFKGDTHVPIRWICQIQHIKDGNLKYGHGKNPQEAIDNCIEKVNIHINRERS